MSRWRRLSRKRRASFLAAGLLVLATTGWAALTTPSGTANPTFEEAAPAEDLKAPLLPPDEVFIQKTTQFGDFGNVLVTVRLSTEQLAAKTAEGTRDFVVIGNPEAPVILRDDGVGGDVSAGDGIFSGPGFVSDADLAERDTADDAELASRTDKTVPVFAGRAAIGVEQAEGFNLSAFQGGQAVPLGPAVAFLEPEGSARQTAIPAAEASSKGLITAKITSAAPVVPGTSTFQDRVLMIRDLGVVTDATRTWDPCTGAGTADGVWTFNHLMTEMANPVASGIDPADFAQSWVNNWAVNLTINGDSVPARNQMTNIVNLWPKRTDGKLDLAKSPLRLLAINPRVDLRRTTGGGGPYSANTSGNFLDAGEARFTFGFAVKVPVGQNPNNLFVSPIEIPPAGSRCFAVPFTVIFEYRVAKCDCKDVKSWANQWIALKGLTPGSAAYNSRLEAITEQFVLANSNPRNPNGSSLGQLRTNEIGISSPFFSWELREFQLTQFPFSFLQETTTDDSPRNASWNNNDGTGLLRTWIVNVVKPDLSGPDFEDSIKPVQLFLSGTNFLAGKSQVTPEANPDFLTFHWKEPTLNVAGDLQENWARHRVSRAACNGCHRRETFTHFVHIDPDDSIIQSPWDDTLNGGLGGWTPPIIRSNPALPAEISLFLTGINALGDPANSTNTRSPNVGTPKRNFDDLARRELDIKKVGRMTCFRFHPANAAHVKTALRSTGRLPTNLFEGLSVVPVEQRVSVAVDDMTANHITEPH